jgi:hypothetical protein
MTSTWHRHPRLVVSKQEVSLTSLAWTNRTSTDNINSWRIDRIWPPTRPNQTVLKERLLKIKLIWCSSSNAELPTRWGATLKTRTAEPVDTTINLMLTVHREFLSRKFKLLTVKELSTLTWELQTPLTGNKLGKNTRPPLLKSIQVW